MTVLRFVRRYRLRLALLVCAGLAVNAWVQVGGAVLLVLALAGLGLVTAR